MEKETAQIALKKPTITPSSTISPMEIRVMPLLKEQVAVNQDIAALLSKLSAVAVVISITKTLLPEE
ncbi:MAG: hypothetical protein LBG59_02640 [Candidatus Peribacteria bacterium]|nr:hypothetical protein [Candidatus Peribacteria bacterium]